ncbi:MAG TPA: hypothetical protein VJN93_02050 [Candidatus Acidoferrum sp.]|nr:hypothetical protein [Candidatus Acidoferrum sp.]
MNLHRFLAYAVLACWIGLTAVLVGTALLWSGTNAMTEVNVQRAANAQKMASATAPSPSASSSNASPDDQDANAPSSSAIDRAAARAEAASEAVSDSINLDQAYRKQFWWELGVWGCLTLLASALLAERRDTEERSVAHR